MIFQILIYFFHTMIAESKTMFKFGKIMEHEERELLKPVLYI